MLFNSLVFAIFLPIVLVLYWLLKTPRRQNVFLLFASLVFYGWWDWRFLSLLLLSTCVDYGCALAIAKARGQGETGKRWLLLSMGFNLSMLGFFKYCNFFIGSATPIWEALGWRPELLSIVLPVGISFYTFQTMAYTVDVYRGNFEARRSFIDVAAYVTFFPQLVAGPIERPTNLLGQLEEPRTLTLEGIRMGLMLMLTGFLMKVVLADGIAPVVEWVFGRLALGEHVSGSEVLLGTYAFSFQVYGDFAGYSRIARGVAKLLGIDLMINFYQPYFSRSFTELWGRWHVSFSQWLRDYLYYPLGGNRCGPIRNQVNVMLTMLLGGLWHGAAWTYVVWGGLHGCFLIVERLLNAGRPKGWSVGRSVFGVVFTFHLWAVAALFFRAPSFKAAWSGVTALATSWSLPDLGPTVAVCLGFALMLFLDLPHLLHPKEELPQANRGRWMLATLGVAGACFYLFPPGAAVSFIYFQF